MTEKEFEEMVEENWPELLDSTLICEALTEGVLYPFKHSIMVDGLTRHQRESKFEEEVHYPLLAELVIKKDAIALGTMLIKQIETWAKEEARRQIEARI